MKKVARMRQNVITKNKLNLCDHIEPPFSTLHVWYTKALAQVFMTPKVVTQPHPILIIAECAKTSQPMEFDQTISSQPRKRAWPSRLL